MQVFLDANVLFSAAKSAGAIRELLECLIAAGHRCCVDEYVVAEARRNLEIKFPQGTTTLDTLLAKIQVAPYRPGDLPSDAASLLPEKDRPVLHAAIRLGCEALVTGDQTHFGTLFGATVHGVTVYSPRGLAEMLSL